MQTDDQQPPAMGLTLDRLKLHDESFAALPDELVRSQLSTMAPAQPAASTPNSLLVVEDPIIKQKCLMREKREAAIRRRREQDEREEAEKMKRIRAKKERLSVLRDLGVVAPAILPSPADPSESNAYVQLPHKPTKTEPWIVLGPAPPVSNASGQPHEQTEVVPAILQSPIKPLLSNASGQQTEAAQLSPTLKSVRSARFLMSINDQTYLPAISSPNPALNSEVPMGKFLYDKDFLMQFQPVFCGKSSGNWDELVTQTVGDRSHPPDTAQPRDREGNVPSADSGKESILTSTFQLPAEDSEEEVVPDFMFVDNVEENQIMQTVADLFDPPGTPLGTTKPRKKPQNILSVYSVEETCPFSFPKFPVNDRVPTAHPGEGPQDLAGHSVEEFYSTGSFDFLAKEENSATKAIKADCEAPPYAMMTPSRFREKSELQNGKVVVSRCKSITFGEAYDCFSFEVGAWIPAPPCAHVNECQEIRYSYYVATEILDAEIEAELDYMYG